MKDQLGFTLIELLLSVVIIGMLSGLSLPVYESFARRNDLDVATLSVVNAIRRSETYARAVQGDSIWGIRFQSSAVILFKGATYASRDANFDESIDVPDSVTVSGLSEVQFAKLTAAPNTTGTVTFTSTTNDTRTLTLNAKGMVDY
jgi:prepilin-type N-terminal cleavage/methylation domain-containing protein